MRLLIVKFSSIGDCVMAVPVASRVRRALPDSFIGWAVDPRCAAVLDTQRLLNLQYDIPWEQWKKNRTGPISKLRHYLKLRP
jgi:heptosyltransferase-1